MTLANQGLLVLDHLLLKIIGLLVAPLIQHAEHPRIGRVVDGELALPLGVHEIHVTLGRFRRLYQIGVVGDDHAQQVPGVKVLAAKLGRIARVAHEIVNLGERSGLTVFPQERADAHDVEAAPLGARFGDDSVTDVLLLSAHAFAVDARVFLHEALEEFCHLALLERPGIGEGALLLGPLVKYLVKLICR